MTVQLDDVSRRFGSVQALERVTFDAPAGAITVLLGPNGAGKTTAIRMITGALGVDAGTVRVFGLDPYGPAGEEVRRRCGVVSAKPSLYDRLSGLDNLRYGAELFGLGRRCDDRLVAAAATFGIEHALGQLVGGYSTGMKTRLALARAIVADPDLLLLDEPTSGLDPESAAAVLELIRTMTAEGRTVVLCTHLLVEAEGLADRVVVMDDGTTVLAGEPTELAARFWPDHRCEITVADGADLDPLAQRPGVVSFIRHGDSATVELASSELVPDLVTDLVTRGARVLAVEPKIPTLEQLYFEIRARAVPPCDPTPAPTDRPAVAVS